jgi:GNAT superfamily N-acetyltransferase
MNTIDQSRITEQPVTVTFLEMRQHPANSIAPKNDTAFELLPKPISVEEYRRYYYGVGERWHWLDRMVMNNDLLYEKINAENVDIYLFTVRNQPAGFAEFVKYTGYVEILYFGLLPAFIGKGLGSYFLQLVIQQAWNYLPQWIQLNTCTLDHPNALNVYKSAGFKEVKKTIENRKVLPLRNT